MPSQPKIIPGSSTTARDFIPFFLPDIGEEEIGEVVDTLRSRWITTGPKAAQFEEEFARYVEAGHALMVNSGTAALHLALDAAGVRAGDLVITTPYTFTATAEVIRYLGADPWFVDIDRATLLLDPERVEDFCASQCRFEDGRLVHRESGRTVSAMIPVHIAGLPCDMDALHRTANRYGLAVVEDAAHALPTGYRGRLIGSGPGLAAFSFYATKPLNTGEGGAVTTDDPEAASRMKMMRLHGMTRDAFDRYHATTPSWRYEIAAPGFKYNMTDIAAAMGIQQLKKMKQFHERRSRIARLYDEGFAGLDAVALPARLSHTTHSWHLYIIQITEPSIDRDRFIEEMAAEGVGASVHFMPLHIQPYYRDRYGFAEDAFPNAMAAFRGAVSLPIHTRLSDSDVERVVDTVRTVSTKLSK